MDKINQSRTILHIDPDLDELNLIHRNLKLLYANLQVHSSQNVQKGLELLKEHKPHCILVDHSRPYSLADELFNPKIRPLNTPIIILSNNHDHHSLLELLKKGASDFVSKQETSRYHLLGAIESSIEKFHLKKQLEKKTIEALENSKLASLGILAGGVAHEINNPLTILQGQYYLIKKNIDNGELERAHHYLDKAETTTHRISKIVQGLQYFCGNYDFGQTSITTPQKIIDLALSFVRGPIQKRGIKVLKDIPSGLNLYCSEAQIAHVIMNLLNNAIDALFHSKDKWITIDVNSIGDFITISISDSGPGISETIQSKIMDPFFTTKQTNKCPGLGLSISKGIINKYNGELYLDSTQNKSTFIVKLPRYYSDSFDKAS